MRDYFTPVGRACAEPYVYCTSTSVQNAHATSRLHVYDGRPQHPRGHSEAQEDGSAAPRGLEPRHRLVGPRPHGALTVCGPLGVLWCVSNSSYTSRPIHKPLRYSPHHDESTVSHHSPFRMGMHPPRVANLCTRGQDWWEGSWCGRPPHTIVACRHDRRTLRVPRCRQVA
jgi:hypothetical protein